MKIGTIVSAVALVTLAACATSDPGIVIRDRPIEVKVPVVQPCAGERPAAVTPLMAKTPHWADLDVRQKAALVGKQALELRTYGEQLAAATGACP